MDPISPNGRNGHSLGRRMRFPSVPIGGEGGAEGHQTTSWINFSEYRMKMKEMARELCVPITSLDPPMESI